jgi:hypothetical protein
MGRSVDSNVSYPNCNGSALGATENERGAYSQVFSDFLLSVSSYALYVYYVKIENLKRRIGVVLEQYFSTFKNITISKEPF